LLRGRPRAAAGLVVARGRQKKSTDPPVGTFAKSQTHPPTIRPFFVDFFLVRFWAFLGKGSSKTPLKYFSKKSMSKTFPIKTKKISKCVFLDFDLFCFIAFSSVSQRWELKNTTKNVLQNNRVFTKKSTKNQKPIFSRFALSRFWAFLGGGVQKHDKKISEKGGARLLGYYQMVSTRDALAVELVSIVWKKKRD
jgi:hypothetical protein